MPYRHLQWPVQPQMFFEVVNILVHHTVNGVNYNTVIVVGIITNALIITSGTPLGEITKQ